MSRARYVIALAFISLTGAALVILATHQGIATSPDSARYIRSARHALGREPETPVLIEAPAEQAHYPPLYPTILALLSMPGADPLDAARWLNVFLIAANAALAAELVRRGTSSFCAALITAAGIAITPGSLSIHVWALSEPLYIAFTLVAFLFLLIYLQKTRWRDLILAGTFIGAAMLTRYAGAALIPTGFLIVLLVATTQNLKRRVIAACVFAGIASILPIAWSIRNALELGSATNRVLAFHPIRFSHFVDLAQVCWNWIGADASVHPILTALAAFIIAGVVVSAIVRRRESLAAMMLIYLGAFGAMLTVSISFVDFHTPIDSRVLAPMYTAWVVLLGFALSGQTAKPLAASRKITLALTSAVFIWCAIRSAQLTAQFFTNGGGYAQRGVRQSAVIAAVKELPQDKVVYTNAPGAVYLLTNFPAIITIPSEFSASSTLRNEDFDAAMTRMGEDLRAGRAYVVYLGRYARPNSTAPTDVQLRKRFGLHPVLRQKLDGIYDYVTPTTSSTTTTSPTTQSSTRD